MRVGRYSERIAAFWGEVRKGGKLEGRNVTRLPVVEKRTLLLAPHMSSRNGFFLVPASCRLLPARQATILTLQVYDTTPI